MKYLSILFLVLSIAANAGSYTQPKASAEANSNNINIAKGGYGGKAYAKGGTAIAGDSISNSSSELSHSGNSSSELVSNIDLADAVKVEGSTYNAGNVSHETSIGMYQPRDFISYQAPLGEIKVGDVSVTTSACGFTVGYNQDRRQFGGSGGAIAGGCSFPIGGAKSALKTATDKLDYELHVMKANEARTEVLHAINVQQMVEDHETQIADICTRLHKAGTLTAAGFADVCDNVSFTDAGHSPMQDVESHKRVGEH